MNRLEKIGMLKELQAGIITVEDFKPKVFSIHMSSPNMDSVRFINGREVDHETYMREITKASETDSEFTTDIRIDGVTLEDRFKKLKKAYE
ncbi:hypothetical protein QWZ08_24995 [Ferruginibacter paludis]|uniref:hypothetical protein n=1 Tax=Ferruginibacter paludis TaxID=1310417 RepID=UPI0025B4E8A9|nr:hypothetical protein [Ferruginibacter paludis]MDN3658925.1 hypothetical protein [Ferruginibacter paludis]